MILCDQIIVEESTRKSNLIGVFSNINSKRFPAVHPRMAIYVALTEGEGDYEGCLRFVFAETEQELFRATGPISLPHPLAVAELHFHTPALPLPKAGKYRLDLLCDGELLKSRSFQAQESSKGDEE